MAKKKIAILGGGMAGLTTAYYLTSTEELRNTYDVTIYQMGWRLGGKAASGRDAQKRNLEHGLHVWFGYYDNSFRLLRDAYDKRTPLPGTPLKEWRDAFKPKNETGIGIQINGEWSLVPVNWPPNGDTPGEGGINSSLWGAITLIAGWLKELVLGIGIPEGAVAHIPPPRFDKALFMQAARTRWQGEPTAYNLASMNADAQHLTVRDAAKVVHNWMEALDGDYLRLGAAHPRNIVDLLEWLADAVLVMFGPRIANDPRAKMTHEALHIFAATVRGAVEDLLLRDEPFESIDHLDFRDWLLRHRADPQIVSDSSIVRVLYDISFQYKDGDLGEPTCAAGSGLGSVVRMLATYKGAMMYHVQAGFGEAVVSPIYEALVAAGVKFKFFHKVEELALSSDKTRIERIKIARQAETVSGDYRPTSVIANLNCWPSEPDWDQLKNGAALKAACVNFESHWCAQPPVDRVELVAGNHFDTVVLAVSMGAYKPLNDVDKGMCDELIASNARFADFVKKIDIVPTLAMQLWSDRRTEELGGPRKNTAIVSGPLSFDIWAEMSQVLAFEPPASLPPPVSLHYFCGTYSTKLHREPASNVNVPRRADALLRANAVAWLNGKANAIWPKASDGVRFDWSVLHDPQGRVGEHRFDNQFWRANIDPTECCVASGHGTTKYRLYPHESGFTNLILTGEGTRHGLNATAVEAAVMSGMAAARAICGSPETIVGFDFLSRKPSEAERPYERPVDNEPVRHGPLPKYISHAGHGESCGQPPAIFSNVTATVFGVRAPKAATQAMVDKLLNPATKNGMHYETFDNPLGRPAGGPAFISFVDVAKASTQAQSKWVMPGRECAIWIPLIEKLPGRLPRLVFWAPYVFIDYGIGLVTGREVWGWQKALGDISIPADASGPFTCNTIMFERAAGEVLGKMAPAIQVISRQRSSRLFQPISDVLQAGLSFATGAFGTAMRAIIGTDLTVPFPLPIIALKQFRDSKKPELACYQEIVNSPCRLTGFHGQPLVLGDLYTLRLANSASHGIGRDLLGVAAGPTVDVPVDWAVRFAFDFEALPGDVVGGGRR
jgi:uncharacterized protein with NAD-binding domain and iron-sulfur cluster